MQACNNPRAVAKVMHFAKNPHETFEEVEMTYLKGGVVISTAELYAQCAHTINSQGTTAWFINMMVGRGAIHKVIAAVPYPAEMIGFKRRKYGLDLPIRWYKWGELTKKSKNLMKAKD